jgi:hypothetical protein
MPSLAWAKCKEGEVLVIDAGNIKCESQAQIVPGGTYPPYWCGSVNLGRAGIGVGATTDSIGRTFYYLNSTGYLFTFPTYSGDPVYSDFNFALIRALLNLGWHGTVVFSNNTIGVSGFSSRACSFAPNMTGCPGTASYNGPYYYTLPNYPNYSPSVDVSSYVPTIQRIINDIDQRLYSYAFYGTGVSKTELYYQTINFPGVGPINFGYIHIPTILGADRLYTRTYICNGTIRFGCSQGDQYDPTTDMCIQMVAQCSPGTTYNPSTGKCEGQAQKAIVKVQVN